MSEITTEKYWDCECKEKYIHPATKNVCPICGCEKDDQPDSIISEVVAELEAQNKRLFVEELCDMFPNGWSHEDALITYYTTRDDKQSDSGHDLIYYIRDEATKTNGILKEKDGNYILRSK